MNTQPYDMVMCVTAGVAVILVMVSKNTRRMLLGFVVCCYLILCLLKLRVKTKILALKLFVLSRKFRRLALENRELVRRQQETFAKNLCQRNCLNHVGNNVSETHK